MACVAVLQGVLLRIENPVKQRDEFIVSEVAAQHAIDFAAQPRRCRALKGSRTRLNGIPSDSQTCGFGSVQLP